jgi:predicted NBD/HSP70 family sugar kinase
MRPTHLQAIRARNTSNILDVVRRHEPISRTRVVAATGLASTTVSDIVGELLTLGLITEHAQNRRGPGRPSLGLRLNREAALVAAGILHPATLELKLADLGGRTLFSGSAPFESGPLTTAFADRLEAAFRGALAPSGHAVEALHSLGLAVPAVVDTGAGLLHVLPPHPPTDFPLAALLSERLRLPVTIDTIPNALGRAERWFGDGQDVDDFALVTMGFGLGLSCYVGGALWHGDGGLSPEIAHVKVPVAEPTLCFCGDRGCLVTAAGVVGMTRRICERLGEPAPGFGQVIETFHRHAARARAGDAIPLEVYRAGGVALGLALANHINLWSPDRIIVMSLDAVVGDLLRETILATIDGVVRAPYRGRTEILFKTQEAGLMAKGAVAMALERLVKT